MRAVSEWRTSLERAPTEVASDAAAVDALRRWLSVNLGDVCLKRAARAMCMSERTLQRRLHAAGTTFVAEIHAAQICAAQTRMLTTSDPLGQIAIDVGCASLQHFSALFRKMTCEKASAWRRVRQQGGRLASTTAASHYQSSTT